MLIKYIKMENFKSAETLQLNTNLLENGDAQYYDMIVFSHLRWEFVYQRPQHIISRMAKTQKVLMIEEPTGFTLKEENTATLSIISPNLHILQPKVQNIDAIATILSSYIANTNIPVGWFYSAAFSPLLNAVQFETVVYDCMDELSLFKGAPQELINQEKYLLSNADVVFTGGKSLYESKNKMHNNVYCFPSSVDEAHFAQALNGIAVPSDIAVINGPIIGYFGVIDERIDLELLKESAAMLPGVSFIMIGPLAKIAHEDLPMAPNIHYLGMKSYEVLPAYLKAFDIAMMPFALNDSTKFISPTKTLEYMAAGKPIISTKITDVVRDYSDCLQLVETAEEFCAAVSCLLNTENQFETREQYQEILKNTSWDATVDKMKHILKSVTV